MQTAQVVLVLNQNTAIQRNLRLFLSRDCEVSEGPVRSIDRGGKREPSLASDGHRAKDSGTVCLFFFLSFFGFCSCRVPHAVALHECEFWLWKKWKVQSDRFWPGVSHSGTCGVCLCSRR